MHARILAAALALLAVSALAAAPLAGAAVHGVPFVATGVALTPAGEVLGITVRWSGFCQWPTTWSVALSDIDTGEELSRRVFAGSQAIYDIPFGNAVTPAELLFIVGTTTDPTVSFSLTGLQAPLINYAPHLMNQWLTGTYQGYNFAVTTVAQSWSFC